MSLRIHKESRIFSKRGSANMAELVLCCDILLGPKFNVAVKLGCLA